MISILYERELLRSACHAQAQRLVVQQGENHRLTELSSVCPRRLRERYERVTIYEVRWYGASHFERIVRWLFTRPPRVQTISAVTAALQESAS